MTDEIPLRVRKRVAKKGNEGTVTKSVEKKNRGVVVSSSENVEKFKGAECLNPAYVTVNGSITKNLGDFNSIRVQVGISLPCEPAELEVRATFDKASAMVDEFVGLELENALGSEGK